MDCKFMTAEGQFNYRVAGVFVKDGRLLAMKDQVSDAFYYLPGGRVRMHETMEQALRREIREELYVDAKVIRPLWLCESFFTVEERNVHELAMYFLAELDWTGLPSLTETFRSTDTDGWEHPFFWLTEEQARDGSIFPLVLGETWPNLPQALTLITDERDRAVCALSQGAHTCNRTLR